MVHLCFCSVRLLLRVCNASTVPNMLLAQSSGFQARCLLLSVHARDIFMFSPTRHVKFKLQMVGGKKLILVLALACIAYSICFSSPLSNIALPESWLACSRPAGVLRGSEWSSWQPSRPHQSQQSHLSSDSAIALVGVCSHFPIYRGISS